MKKAERNLFSIFLSLGSIFAIFSGFFILGIGINASDDVMNDDK
ncbi:hypothetical protein [Staphylococcus capitis]